MLIYVRTFNFNHLTNFLLSKQEADSKHKNLEKNLDSEIKTCCKYTCNKLFSQERVKIVNDDRICNYYHVTTAENVEVFRVLKIPFIQLTPNVIRS